MSLPPPFGDLSPEEETQIIRRLRRRIYRRSEVVFRAGDIPRAIYFLQSGVVELHHPQASPEVPLARIVSGKTLGADVLLLDKTYRATAQAASDITLEALSREDLEEILAERPNLVGKLSVAMGARIIQADDYLMGRYLAGYSALKGLPNEALRSLAARFRLVRVPRGGRFPEGGEGGRGLYFVESGRLRPSGALVEGFTQMGPGAALGYGREGWGKDWQVEASTESHLWAVAGSELEEVLRRYSVPEPPSVQVTVPLEPPSLPSHPSVGELASSPIFAELGEMELADIAKYLEGVHFHPGERIALAGSSPQAMYFIQKGTVREVPSAQESLHQGTTIWGVGDAVGALALLTDSPHASTVEAISEVEAWALGKADFDRLLVAYPRLALSLSQKLTGFRSGAAPDLSSMPPLEPAGPASIQPGEPVLLQVSAQISRAREWFLAQPWGIRLVLIAVAVLILWLLLVSLPTTLRSRNRAGSSVSARPSETSLLEDSRFSPFACDPGYYL